MRHNCGVDDAAAARLTATVSGWVQGVSFRWSTMSLARTMNLVGLAENLPDGGVRVIVEGLYSDCRKVVEWLYGAGPQTIPRPGRVDSVDVSWSPAEGTFRSFTCR